MTIWILALLLLASLAGLGLRQGAIRVGFSLVGILFGALLASPLSGPVKSILSAVGVKSPILLWLLPPLIVFVFVLALFKVAALFVHQKVEVYYKYNAGDLRISLWERLNHRLGLCLGIANGVAYFVLATCALYPLSYWSYQMARPDSDPKTVRLINRLGKDLEDTGMSKVARALDKNPPEFYEAADVVGLVYQHPLLEARLSRYPAFLGLAERPEFQELATDTQFSELRQRQASLAELIKYPRVQAMIQNADLLKTIKDSAVTNLSDLQAFLTNGVSEKFGEKILGRWNFDPNSSILLVRKAKPNISAKEVLALRRQLTALFTRTSLVATTDEKAFLKNMPSMTPGAQPGEGQKFEGEWKGADGNYIVSLTADGRAQQLTAQVQGDRLTLSGLGSDLAFSRED
jgi:hypothetical protein